jgi:glutamate formiminotransferase
MYIDSVTGILLAVPNISTGRSSAILRSFSDAAVGRGVTLLDSSSDVDHDRSVVTLAGRQGVLAVAVAAAVGTAVESIDLSANRGVHPHVGVVDVAPIVYLDRESRGAACAEALVLGSLIGDELGLPVFLYGEISGGRSRSELRRGGAAGLGDRVGKGLVKPDFGPSKMDSAAGATLVAARPPLVALNFVLEPTARLEHAKAAAAEIRETEGGGFVGVRALGLELQEQGLIQVSCNIEDHHAVSIAEILGRIESHSAVSHGELIGLAPEAEISELIGLLAMPGLDPEKRSIEGSLRLSGID